MSVTTDSTEIPQVDDFKDDDDSSHASYKCGMRDGEDFEAKSVKSNDDGMGAGNEEEDADFDRVRASRPSCRPHLNVNFQ
ncbi:hypothetical protein CYMTET_23552 [Cymbomonas tetramitiformis]|uniref:Uncharacterized protein n=1 Tax=Cymbomonas tetramitiformis TaxID=36881 RepID=A0AAE0L101_9CHLO|nr:hypothetical protein CYMTET_23552 [Cymbomonas tetramitiformis]